MADLAVLLECAKLRQWGLSHAVVQGVLQPLWDRLTGCDTLEACIAVTFPVLNTLTIDLALRFGGNLQLYRVQVIKAVLEDLTATLYQNHSGYCDKRKHTEYVMGLSSVFKRLRDGAGTANGSSGWPAL